MQTSRFRTRFCTSLLFTAVLLLLSTTQIQAQEDEDVLRVNTNLVVLNVTVTDKSGRYVPGLKRKDFKVFEDGIEIQDKLITGFSVQQAPFAAVVLLDTSGSMESRLTLARSAAIRFLNGLREEDVAAVFKFDYKVEPVQDFSSGRDLAPVAYGIQAKGMTTLHDAIVEAAHALSDRAESRKAIVVLSDGMDTYSKASSDKAVESALAVGASIYAVDMTAIESSTRNRQTAMALKAFAEKTGGRFVATPGGPALRDAFSGIAEELGNQYTIAYRPSKIIRDGKWHTLEVKLSQPELVVRTRKGYRAPKK
jgi:Ca-activated chloride channel homolog